MKVLFIEKLKDYKENRFFSGEGIINLIPREEITHRNWLITNYSGDDKAFKTF